MKELVPKIFEGQNNYISPFLNYPLIEHESPKTAIARRIPHSAIHLLDRESKRKHYVDSLEIGANIVHTYLNKSNSEDIQKISKISIKPDVVNMSGFFSFNKGMEIIFERKKEW